MKKILLTALIASAATITFAEVKSTTFALSSSSTWGVSDPEDGDGVELVGSTKTTTSITSDDITLKVEKGTANYARLWNTNGVITFRPYKGNILTFSATGFNITKITFDANGGASKCLLTTTEGTFTYPDWTGSASSVAFNATGTSQLLTATVTYETAEGGNGGNDNNGGVEQYAAANKDGLSPEFANASVSEGLSTIEFSTAHIKATAVGGATPKDVQETEAGTFPGWAEWNEISWSKGERNINDDKTMYFYYVNGKGNPFTSLEPEAVMTEGAPTGMWRAKYNLYVPDGSNGLPISGLYYKFTPSIDGKLRLKIWSNKGNRNTFVVDDDTKLPIKYSVEGYINGQNEVDPNSAESRNKMKYLENEEIQAIHNAAKVTYTYAEDGVTKIDSVDSAPYVIGAGGQPFFGWVVIEVKAGKTYWLFQDSSQIGFGGFDFAYGEAELPEIEKSEEADIHSISADNKKAVIYDICGNRVTKMIPGRIYIQNGKKIFVR